MEWYVYYYDPNGRAIKAYNVLGNSRIKAFIRELKKKYKDSKDDFAEKLQSELMYHYWSRSQWEIILLAWCGGDGSEARKIDAYDQIKMNWNQFIDYCWNYNARR